MINGNKIFQVTKNTTKQTEPSRWQQIQQETIYIIKEHQTATSGEPKNG